MIFCMHIMIVGLVSCFGVTSGLQGKYIRTFTHRYYVDENFLRVGKD